MKINVTMGHVDNLPAPWRSNTIKCPECQREFNGAAKGEYCPECWKANPPPAPREDGKQ